jgi:phosphoglucosamine mutase
MAEFFGTDGIRGVAGRFPLDEATIARIGYSLVRELRSGTSQVPLIISGRDTRESGTWIEQAVLRGARTAGAQVKSAGIITTPGVAFLARSTQADAGIVISASHNSYEDNGIKIFATTGQKLSDTIEQAIERDLTAAPEDFPPMAQGEVSSEPELKRRYLEFLRDQIGKGLDLTGLKIVVDCAEGAAYELAPELFTSLGATTLAIHNSPNGRNINLNCGSLHPQELQQKVVASGADLGIAFDGDADRLMLVDERGALLDGDYILFILAEHMRERDRLTGGRVVATVMSNLGLELSLGKLGIALTRTSVGDKFVLEELLAGGGSLGGEQSGHVIFPEISLAGDGMITALEVLRVLSQPARESRRSLSELSEGMKRYPQVMINVPVARKPPLESVAPLREAIDALDQELLGRGRLLVRYSGTENLARVMIEGRDEKEIHHQAETLARLIQEHLGSG